MQEEQRFVLPFHAAAQVKGLEELARMRSHRRSGAGMLSRAKALVAAARRVRRAAVPATVEVEHPASVAR
jgi:hypothetical protein